MKYLLSLSFTFIMFSCFSQSGSGFTTVKASKGLTAEDSVYAKQHGIDHSILEMVRIYTDSSLLPLIKDVERYDMAIEDVVIPDVAGFTIMSDEVSAREIVLKLKDHFNKKGYLIYVSASNFGYQSDEVSVIRSKDQFDILLIQGTTAVNYNIYSEDVIKKLKEWHKKYPFQIIGAGNDWMEAAFIEKPGNMNAFAKEVYEFCPDVVDQGTGSIKELKRVMDYSNTLYLWWD